MRKTPIKCQATAGFGGGLRVVTEWATRRRRAEKAENGLGHAPAARTIVRLMTLERNNLTTAQTMTVAAIEERLPDLVEARDVVDSFHKMLRSKSKDDLEAWIDRAARSLFASFANGVIRDWAAVENAITSMWSNGQTEGQITKLKFIKRQMYGRGKLDLLEAYCRSALMSSRLRQTPFWEPIRGPATTPIDNPLRIAAEFFTLFCEGKHGRRQHAKFLAGIEARRNHLEST